MSTTDSGYLLDNSLPEADARLAALAQLYNPGTFGHLSRLGIAPGWRCWEVGAGGPSVVNWLADQVGPSGAVLATDINTAQVRAAESGVVSVRQHDVGTEGVPEPGGFDLVHARLVLIHVPGRDQALRTMAAALRPGGWLLVEDADTAAQPEVCLDERGPDQELANRLRRGLRAMLAQRGGDLSYGRKLPRLFREAGLVEVGAEARFWLAMPAGNVLEAISMRQIRAGLVAGGHATDEEIDRHLANVAAGRLDLGTSPLVSVWGRRPVE